MKKKLLYLLLICIFILTGCTNSKTLNNNTPTDKIETTEDRFKNYLNTNIDSVFIKSITINKLENEMYDIVLNYEKDVLYLHICAEDSQSYAKDLLETQDSFNEQINSLKLVCKENGTIKYNIDINNFNKLTVDTIEANTILKDGQGNNLNKTVQQVKDEHITEYKNSCSTYDYKTIFRYAEEYKGKNVKYTGKVVQVIEGLMSTSYRVNVTKDEWGFYDDTIYVTFLDLVNDNTTPRILEDDIITVYGVLSDLYTYETVLGASVTIPSITALYIDIVG